MGYRTLDQLRVFRNSVFFFPPITKVITTWRKFGRCRKAKKNKQKNFKNKYILSIIPILTAKCVSAALFGDFHIYLHSQPYLEVM